MGLAIATYSLTLVCAAVPFFLILGQAFFRLPDGNLATAFQAGMGEWFFIGITLSIASVLVAVDTIFDSTEKRLGPLVSEFAIWSGITGLICLVGFTVYTLVKENVAIGPHANSIVLIALGVVVVTIGTNAVTYIKVRVSRTQSDPPPNEPAKQEQTP